MIFPQRVKDLIKEIELWRKSRDWYRDRGIPWKRGWMLYHIGDERFKFMWDAPPPNEWVSLDCETTGLDVHRDQIISVGAVRIAGNRLMTSERLVASVTLVNPNGLKRHGGQVWFGFAFPPEVHELVMAPGTYTRLSIFYQGLLRSGASLALYEICRRYATNPSHMTSIETYEHWYGVLTGNPVVSDSLPPYKYFKRDVLKPAIAEINALTDIQIELVEHKSARRVERLQFRVEVANQSQLEFPAPPVIDLELLGRLMKFGFNQNEASDLMAQHSESRLRATIAAVDARMVQKGGSKLESPAAYFRWCLKQDTLPTPLLASEPRPAAKTKKTDGGGLMERFHDARAKEALGLFDEMNAPDRLPVMARFKAAYPDQTVVKKSGDHEVPVMRAVFGHWYAMDLWGEPSAADLAAFVEQSAR